MPVGWSKSVDFYRNAFETAVQTDLAQVRYGSVPTALWLAAAVGAVLALTLARMALLKRKHSRAHSGYGIASAFRRRPIVLMLQAGPKLLVAGAVAILLAAAADPFLTTTEEVAGSVESRLRIDLVDVSGSMAWEMLETGKSKAEIARESHLEFLKMRRGKNDRVSLWLFSTYPYMVDDFIIDDDLYYSQVDDAPYVITAILDRTMIVPREKTRIVPAEGSSNIARPLEAIMKHFDSDDAAAGAAGARRKAVLIISDAAVDEFSEDTFMELNRRSIVPYIVYINSNSADAERREPPLIERIREYGGDYFDVRDQDSLTRAYRAIDEREAVQVEIKHVAHKVPIYPRFLLMAMAMLAIAIPAGIAGELLWGTYP
jgi:hypothetical protein